MIEEATLEERVKWMNEEILQLRELALLHWSLKNKNLFPFPKEIMFDLLRDTYLSTPSYNIKGRSYSDVLKEIYDKIVRIQSQIND